MSVNKQLPHVIVLPEDDANRQLANGFHKQVDWNRYRQMQVLPEARGWTHVVDDFLAVHIALMDRYPARLMVLLIDCDGEEERLRHIKEKIPGSLAERVFVLGALTEPEALRARLGSYEEIGEKLARDCRENTNETWGDALLEHNAAELARLREYVLPILFPII
ncbi:MAG: hypothetical protein WA672_01360 [Candidatus Angelobacter sp.]